MPPPASSEDLTILYQPIHPRNSPTYPLLPKPISTPLLTHPSAYFSHLVSTNPNITTHTLTGPPILFRSYQILLTYMAAIPSGNAQLNLVNRTYTSLALLYQAARVMRMGSVEARLLRRLRMCDLERREVEELVRAVGVGDVCVGFVVEDLAGQWVNGMRERRLKVNELVKRVREQWPEFGVMFEREVRRLRGRLSEVERGPR